MTSPAPERSGQLERFSSLSPGARVIWAKSGVAGGHGLLAHLLDVAAVAETILEREPPVTLAWLCETFGVAPAQSARFLGACAGLHDYGKAIPGFQAKWLEGQQADLANGLCFEARSCAATDHAYATAALLGDGLQRCASADPRWVRHVLQAISAHHGFHYRLQEFRNARPQREAPAWAAARAELLCAYWAALDPAATVAREELDTPAVAWLAGLTSVADWIASNPDWFPLGERFDDLKRYVADAKLRAARALEQIGWSSYRSLLNQPLATADLLGRVLSQQGVPAVRPLQEQGDKLLAAGRGQALVLVEAPMGEGKTELAFLAHLRLQMRNHHRGLYVAMPTQATGNALFTRACRFLQAFADRHLDIQLVHGGSAMNQEIRHLRDIDHSRAETISTSAWFAQKRRPLLSPYGVGTIDQALFSVLNVKHHFVRLWGLSNRVVVLDEVHAYDTYTSGLIEALLRWLRALGSSVILMSATLPKRRRDAFLAAWGGDCSAVESLAYPRVLVVDERGARGAHFDSRPLPEIRMAAVDENLAAITACAVEAVHQGGCGAIIVNTVDRAQQLYRLLWPIVDQEVELLLFHARFPADQRAEIERAVVQKFGPCGRDDIGRPAKALLIATQVAEQSLDLDFDFMISDLAPVDLVLQRAGRLHRHARQRPAHHREAVLKIAGLQPERLPDFKTTAWGVVYDPYILARTWALLSRQFVLRLPGDIDRLVQAVYDSASPLPDDVDSAVREYIEAQAYGEYRAHIEDQKRRALNIAIDHTQESQNAYVDKPRGAEEDELLGHANQTRLGRETVILVPLFEVPGGWSVRPGGVGISLDQPISDDVARQFYARQIRVSKKAVVMHFRDVPLPDSFRDHPLLENIKPMKIKDGSCAIGASLRLVLDPVLGLVFTTEDFVPAFEGRPSTCGFGT